MSAVCMGESFLVREKIRAQPTYGQGAQEFMHRIDTTAPKSQCIDSERRINAIFAAAWQARDSQ